MLSILICLLVAAAPPAARKKVSPVMQIKFVRSGGFAGTATNVTGAVEFGDHDAQVHADATDYRRDLTPEERENLRSDAESAKTALPETGAVRDGYQYDVTVVTKDGKSYALTLPAGDKAKPGVARLGSWIKDETEKIWRYRVAARKIQ